MTDEQIRGVFEAVKSDDLKRFTTFMLSKSDLNLCFGRFPLLSLCYLYGSYKILNKYEKYMLGISNFNIILEYGEIYVKFKREAKKSIRFFSGENIVYPIQMLAILGDNETISKYYDKLFKNGEIVEILRKIYNLNEKVETEISVAKFKSTKNKSSKFQKICLSVVSILLCLLAFLPWGSILIIKNSTGLGSKNSPIIIRNEQEFKTALNNGKLHYKLDSDIVLSEEFSVEKFSGNLDGNGYVLSLDEKQGEALIKNLNGTVENLLLQVETQNLEIQNNTAIIAQISSGNIKKCEIYGSLNLNYNSSEDVYFSGFVFQNNGTIEESILNMKIVATNDTIHNAFLSGFASENNGKIIDCETARSSFETDTVDVAGFVCDNNGEITNVKNLLSISQTSSKEWHPNTAGVALNNNAKILFAENYGDISSTSSNEKNVTETNPNGFAVYSAGIACVNISLIESSKNYGKILATAKTATIYAGGIASCNYLAESSMGQIKNSKAVCNIEIKNEDEEKVAQVGGICGVSQGSIDVCGYEGNLSLNSTGGSVSGGLVGAHYLYAFDGNYNIVSNSYSASSFTFSDGADNKNLIGGLIGCYISGGTTLVLSNNHYVRNSSFAYGMNHRLVINGMIISQSYVLDEQAGFKSYDTLEKLKETASGVNAND